MLTGFTNLFLCLLKLGKRHKQVFIHMFLSEELHRPLIHLSAVSDITVLPFKTSVLDPVLHFGVNDDKCSGVKQTNIIQVLHNRKIDTSIIYSTLCPEVW